MSIYLYVSHMIAVCKEQTIIHSLENVPCGVL